jgi:hypothetical protein
MYGLQAFDSRMGIQSREIVRLTSDKRRRPRGSRKFRNASSGSFGRFDAGCQQFESSGLQGITDEDRGRFVELLVARGTTATQVIVIHCRQVVVNERVGVNQFDGACRGQRRFHLTTAGLCSE